MLRRLIAEEDGQGLVEYGLILGILSVAVTVSLTEAKTHLMNVYNSIGDGLQKAARSL